MYRQQRPTDEQALGKPIPIAAPQPGHAIEPIMVQMPRPMPAAANTGRDIDDEYHSPNSPHYLDPPLTPIVPAFARPAKVSTPSNDSIKFEGSVIRGGSEEKLIPRRGEKGDDFWRRFSMVAKEDSAPGKPRESSWLKKTQNGSSRLSKWVWVIGLALLLLIIGGSLLGWYATRDNPDHQAPVAIGGGAGEVAAPTTVVGDSTGTTTTKHVSPTNTVARREPIPTPGFASLVRHKSHASRRHLTNRSLADTD